MTNLEGKKLFTSAMIINGTSTSNSGMNRARCLAARCMEVDGVSAELIVKTGGWKTKNIFNMYLKVKEMASDPAIASSSFSDN